MTQRRPSDMDAVCSDPNPRVDVTTKSAQSTTYVEPRSLTASLERRDSVPNTRRNSNKLTSTVFARSKPYFRFYIGSTLNFFSRRIFQGVYNENAARAHLDAVQRLQPDESLGHSYLYRCLTVLDAKVQGLLTSIQSSSRRRPSFLQLCRAISLQVAL